MRSNESDADRFFHRKPHAKHLRLKIRMRRERQPLKSRDQSLPFEQLDELHCTLYLFFLLKLR